MWDMFPVHTNIAGLFKICIYVCLCGDVPFNITILYLLEDYKPGPVNITRLVPLGFYKLTAQFLLTTRPKIWPTWLDVATVGGLNI